MARTPLHVLRARALRLHCPHCGGEKMFRGYFTMNEQCSCCGLTYEREPGYFLGSSYVNYGFVAMTTTATFLIGRLVMGWSNTYLFPALMVYSVVFPLIIFRHARAVWLAHDLYFDPEGLPPQPGGEAAGGEAEAGDSVASDLES